MWYNCYTGLRLQFDEEKSGRLRASRKRAVGFEEASELFCQPHYTDQRSDDPEQYRAVGWVAGKLYTVIFEIRHDDLGEYYHLVTLWKATSEDRGYMKQTPKKKKPISAEAIARMADQGKDISGFFTNNGRMVYPIQRVNVDFTGPMLAELDDAADELNISRQAVIKTLVREGLDRRYPRRPLPAKNRSRGRRGIGSRRAASK